MSQKSTSRTGYRGHRVLVRFEMVGVSVGDEGTRAVTLRLPKEAVGEVSDPSPSARALAIDGGLRRRPPGRAVV